MGYVTICERCGSETRLYDHGLTGAVQVIGAGAQPCRACLKKEIAGLQSKLAEEKNIAACRKLVADNLEKGVERLRVRLETAERDRDTANEDATFQHNAAVAAEAEIERLQKLIGELRGAMPLEKLGGDDPEWLADLKRRAAEAAKGES